ncbi:MAG TPA: cytochrome D1 domain-containing protein, partial [Rhodoferax sp.]|nr:cytochrome D1 domain-containing protein [Rhodoferax sp.]
AEVFVPPWCTDQDPRHAAPSADGQWILWSDAEKPAMTLFDAQPEAIRQFTVATRDGKSSSRIHAIYDAPARRSFIVVLRDIPEIWEISYDPKAEPIFDGLVHDYRMGEGVAHAGFLGVRRTLLQTQLADLYFSDDYRTAIGIAPAAHNVPAQAHVINLDVRRELAAVPLATYQPADAAISISADGRTWRAMPGLRQNISAHQALRRYCTP